MVKLKPRGGHISRACFVRVSAHLLWYIMSSDTVPLILTDYSIHNDMDPWGAELLAMGSAGALGASLPV